MENYEQKYNKLINAIKVLQETNPSDEGIQNWVIDNVPELRESEDERIRKEIIAILQYKYEKFSKDPKYCNAPQWIAWLEKQEGCEHIKKDWLEHIKQSWYKEGFIDGKYSGGASKEWTINDTATLKEIINFLENGTAKLQHDLTRYANWLKIQFTPIEKQGEQKKCCGEVNDIAMQQQLQIWFDKGKCSGRDEVIFHPEIYGLQKQGEQTPAWSEDDRDYYDAIIAKLEITQDDAALTDNQMEFLKSLKQRYTWKPNDEQMEALGSAIDEFDGYQEFGSLVSLKKDLEKLKGE